MSRIERYVELMFELRLERFRRQLQGRALSADEESEEFIPELDQAWYAMTAAEQYEADRRLSASMAIPLSRQLSLIDAEVAIGTDRMPRKGMEA